MILNERFCSCLNTSDKYPIFSLRSCHTYVNYNKNDEHIFIRKYQFRSLQVWNIIDTYFCLMFLLLKVSSIRITSHATQPGLQCLHINHHHHNNNPHFSILPHRISSSWGSKNVFSVFFAKVTFTWHFPNQIPSSIQILFRSLFHCKFYPVTNFLFYFLFR